MRPPRQPPFAVPLAIFWWCAAAAAAAAASAVNESGSCSAAKLCCPGRDSSCVVQKTAADGVVVETSDEKPCYCDHACLKLADCCSDFKEACDVVDCSVSAWQSWSECDADCGAGTMWRRRAISKHPANGGRRCPSLIQKRGCLGTNCSQNPRSALKEIATLLPAGAPIELANETQDRWNDDAPSQVGLSINVEATSAAAAAAAADKQYCVLFEVRKVAKACAKQAAFSALNEGDRVCVRCDKEAMRPSLGYRCAGHGTMDRATSWTSLTAGRCHGKWTRLDSSPRARSGRPAAACPVCAGRPHFAFV